jgi:4-hydroxybenzoate polyprenyltransferase
VNEIILDIRDEAGDRNQGIHTIATLYGKQTAWTIAYFVSYINTMMNIVGLLFVGIHPRFYIGIMIPQIYKLYFINKSMFSRESILSHLKYTNQTMVALLLFFMFQTI